MATGCRDLPVRLLHRDLGAAGEAQMSRFVITLKNERGVVVSTADFDTEEAAVKYFEQAQISAKEIGGTAEMDPPPREEPNR
jgi:hypothetical protein